MNKIHFYWKIFNKKLKMRTKVYLGVLIRPPLENPLMPPRPLPMGVAGGLLGRNMLIRSVQPVVGFDSK